MLAFSCKNQKLKNKHVYDNKEHIQLVTTAKDSSSVTQLIKTEVDNTTVTYEVITVYSTPDSLGQQHPISVTVREIRSDGSVKQLVSNKVRSGSFTKAELDIQSRQTGKITQNSKTTYKLPAWVFIAGAVIFAIIILYIRRWILR